MKTIIPLTALAVLAASSLSQAETVSATSKPSGYVTQTLAANTFNLVGITLQSSASAAGSLTAVNGKVLSDSKAAFQSVSGRHYILEILDDANASVNLEGTIQVVPAANITANSVTTVDDLAAFGLQVGAKYSLRLAPTIEEIFGTTTSVLSKGLNSASPASDVIWVPDGASGYTRYYIRSTDNTVRNAQSNGATPNTPLVYTDGLFVQKKDTGASSLVLTGEVKTSVAKLVVTPGFNVVATVFPVGATLQNIGLEASISAGINSASPSSDVVWIPTGGGEYVRYYRRSTDSTWRNATSNLLAPNDVPLTSAVFVQRKASTSINSTLTPPPSYQGL